jgi:hypothetical protein
VLPLDRDIDVVFLGHELFTFYGGEEQTVPEELVAVFEYPAKRTYEYEFESRDKDERGMAIRRFIRLELLATKRECQIILADLRAKGRCDEEFVKALHTWPEEVGRGAIQGMLATQMMGETMDIADAWITGERQREERDREIGRTWLFLVVEGDPDKVGAVINDLAERKQVSNLDAMAKLQVSAMMFMKQVTAEALNRIGGAGSERGCSCGCERG